MNIKNVNDWPSLDGHFVLDRSFNWTFPNPAPESVVLVVEGNGIPDRIELNQRELSCELGRSEDVSAILNAHNHLRLEINSAKEEQPITGVYLAIE